ncbi:HlyU family transcriptional regulator [Nioella nitratireducens]|uniref:HlyU family transcriptional regulator n=1 Tax=Nioella nitratireducens TaxID=1287720 RepID=UPI0008FD00A5|nr:HlyU family transcriptional regulator [Nioella nitratireducens]
MSLFKKLFGGAAAKPPEPVVYKDFRIFPEPVKEIDGYRISARIEKEVGGVIKTHDLIRADMLHTAEQTSDAAVFKAKSLIDQMGDDLF